MELSRNEKIVIWYSLLMQQKKTREGSIEWFRSERLIRRFEQDLGMTERPIVHEVIK